MMVMWLEVVSIVENMGALRIFAMYTNKVKLRRVQIGILNPLVGACPQSRAEGSIGYYCNFLPKDKTASEFPKMISRNYASIPSHNQ